MDWFLYDRDLRHERVNKCVMSVILLKQVDLLILKLIFSIWKKNTPFQSNTEISRIDMKNIHAKNTSPIKTHKKWI